MAGASVDWPIGRKMVSAKSSQPGAAAAGERTAPTARMTSTTAHRAARQHAETVEQPN
jgi:hypothetical protein